MPIAFDQLPAVVVRERVWIPRELIISEEKVFADLTIENGAVHAAARRGFKLPEHVPTHFCLAEATEGHIIVPRAYSVPLRGREGVDYRVVDMTGKRGMIVGADRITLGPHAQQPFDQGPAFAALSAPDTRSHGRMLVLRCGGGKTAIALKAAMKRGGRTLWVTVTDALVEQARDDMERYLDVHPRRIGWIQGAKQRWRGYGIATATLQTLAQSDLPDDFWGYWDLVIFDEGDVLGAPSFHTVVPRFRAERWVLTATPERADGNDALFRLHTGPTCYEHTKHDLEPECYFVATTADEHLARHKGWDPYARKPRIQYQMTAAELLRDEARCELALREVEKALGAGRVQLVVGDSVEGMAMLRQRALTKGIDCSIVTSREKRSTRKEAIKRPPVVFATSKIFQRGLDRVAFDTLIIATLATANDTFVQQTVGRILRANAARPDKRPIVVVLVDIKIDELRGMAGSLAAKFEKLGWKVGGIGPQLIAERKKRRNNRT